MKNKALFLKALSTLFGSWGGDTPPEAVWAANEVLDWYEKEYSVSIGDRFEEDISNYDTIINIIKSH